MSKFTVTIEHVKHRVTTLTNAPVWLTACGKKFVPAHGEDANARHHQPATSTCASCVRRTS